MMQRKVTIPMNRICSLVLFAMVCVPSFSAWAGDDADAVTVKDNKVFALRGDRQDALTAELKFPDEVVVNTNGSFKVAEGKERDLQEGQVLRRDGWLVNPDGSVQPVVDHLGIKSARAYVVRDGQSTPLTVTMVFPNGMSVGPDGYGSGLPGGRNRLLDGQLFRLDGTPIPGKDTVTLKNGSVVVQRDGTLIPLGAVRIMGMNDGTQVRGDGFIKKPDGSTFQLREGQTILIDGAVYGR
jgi:hypothetical protein